jgi:hypothetical protein
LFRWCFLHNCPHVQLHPTSPSVLGFAIVWNTTKTAIQPRKTEALPTRIVASWGYYAFFLDYLDKLITTSSCQWCLEVQ